MIKQHDQQLKIIKSSKRLIRTLLLLPVLFSVACVLETPDPELACNFVQNRDEQRVSWKSSLPVKFRVHKDVPLEAYSSIQSAVSKWNSISTQNVIQVIKWDAEGTPSSGYADGAPTLYWLEEWESNRSSEQGRTTVVWSRDQIRDADIRINSKNFLFSYEGNDLDPLKVDLTSLLVHEFGHALGLGHNEKTESVMYRLLAKGRERREVSKLTDLESFGCEYGEDTIEPTVLAAAQQEESGETEGNVTTGEGEATSASLAK